MLLSRAEKRRSLTQAYADKNKSITTYTLIPYFGKMKLDKITGDVIDKWMDGRSNHKKVFKLDY